MFSERLNQTRKERGITAQKMADLLQTGIRKKRFIYFDGKYFKLRKRKISNIYKGNISSGRLIPLSSI